MSSRWKCKTAFWAVGAFMFGFVCVLGCSFADFVLGSLEDRRQHCVMCFLFVCWLCFGKHGSCEDTQTFRAARRFPVVRLACTLAEEFCVGQPLFRGILRVLRITVRHRDVSFLICVLRNAFCCVALPSVDLHRWTKETLDAVSCFDQGSKSLPSANGCTLI